MQDFLINIERTEVELKGMYIRISVLNFTHHKEIYKTFEDKKTRKTLAYYRGDRDTLYLNKDANTVRELFKQVYLLLKVKAEYKQMFTMVDYRDFKNHLTRLSS